jgi:iron(III) transport system permease protein
VLLVKVFLGEGGGLTLSHVTAIFGESHQRRAFGNSLLLAALVGLLGTVLGFVFAFAAIRGGLPRGWARLLDAATILPLVSPPFTSAIAVIFSFGRAGSSPITCWG